MENQLPLSLWLSRDQVMERFGEYPLEILTYPHLICEFESTFFRDIAHLALGKPCPWPCSPIWNAEGKWQNDLDFEVWKTAYGQEQFFRNWCDSPAVIYANNVVFVDAIELDSTLDCILRNLQRHDLFFDLLKHGTKILDNASWFAKDFGNEANQVLFFCHKDRRNWIDILRDGIRRRGKNILQLEICVDGIYIGNA